MAISGSVRLLRSSWDHSSYLSPPSFNALELALSYGSFFITKTYGSRLSDAYRVGVTTTHFPGRSLPVMPPNARPVSKLTTDRIAEELDTALRLSPLRATILAEDLRAFFARIETEVMGSSLETHQRSRSARRSRPASALRQVRETFEASRPFAHAGAPLLESAWMPPPRSSLSPRRRLA